MPFAAPRPCATPGCPELVRGRSRCDACEVKAGAEDRARRGSAAERGYDARWQKYRLGFLAQHPLCVECAVSGPPGGDGKPRVVPATVVDHIKAHKGDQILFWDPKNHRGVCKPHHDARTDEGDFGRAPRTETAHGNG